MAEHLSDLRLDEIAAGLPAAEAARAHASACPECQARLQAIEAARASARASPGYHRVKAALRSPSPRRWSWQALALPAIAAVAAALVLVVRTEAPGVRLKGGYRVALLAGDGREVELARPGETLSLAVGSAGRAQALVLAVGEDGAVEVLWPVGGTRSAPVPPGANVSLEPPFEVTSGSIEVLAFFSDAPIGAEAAKRALASEVETAMRQGRSPMETAVPAGPWEGAARLLLRVAP